MIRQNQQGFAKLEVEAKKNAEAAKERARTETTAQSDPVGPRSNTIAKSETVIKVETVAKSDAVISDGTSPSGTNDAETTANIERVTAFYLDNDAPEKPVKHAA